MTWLAVVLYYNDNFRKMVSFLNKQYGKLKHCRGQGGCDVDYVASVVADVDKYWKKMVVDHGGPIIDRNWDKE